MSHKGTAVTVKTAPFASRTKVSPATSKGTKVVVRDPQVEVQEYVNGITVHRKLDGTGRPVGQASPTPPSGQKSNIGQAIGSRGGKSAQGPGQTMVRVLDRPSREGGKVVGEALVTSPGIGGVQHIAGVNPAESILPAYDFTEWDTLDTDQKVIYLGTLDKAERMKFLTADKARSSAPADPKGGKDSFGPGEGEESPEGYEGMVDTDTGKPVDPAKVIPPDFIGPEPKSE